MISIKVLICDDQPEYIRMVKEHVLLYMFERRIQAEIFTFQSAEKLLNTTDSFDIAFLDVEIDGISGIDIGKILKQNNPNLVIFIITAHEKYLDDAMDLNVLRFLQKPLNSSRLYAGLEKAVDYINETTVQVVLEDKDEFVNLSISDIMYVEIVNRKTKIVTSDRVYFSKEHLSYWRDMLGCSFFYQPHKSFIINIKFVLQYQRDMLTMTNGDKVPVAMRRQTEFQRYFISYFNSR